jgi:hypothetical protein
MYSGGASHLVSNITVFEIAHMLVCFDHVASLIVTLLVYTQQLKNDMKQAQWRVHSYASNAQRWWDLFTTFNPSGLIVK